MVKKVNKAQTTLGENDWSFLDFFDVHPTTYTGSGGYLVSVKSGEDGLEFVAAPTGVTVAMTDLTDGPGNYTGASEGDILEKAGDNTLRWKTPPATPGPHPTELVANFTDWLSTYTGADGKLLKISGTSVVATDSAADLPAFTVDQASDVPTFAGSAADANKVTRVNAAGNALEFVDPLVAVDPSTINLHSLNEMPTFQAGKFLQGQATGGTGLVYADPPGATVFTELSDTPTQAVMQTSSNNGYLLKNNNGVVALTPPAAFEPLIVAASDEATTLTTGTTKVKFRMPRQTTIGEVRASLGTASSSGVVTVDINQNGASILSTVLTIDQGEKSSFTAATPAVISGGTILLGDDDEITVDIDSAGNAAAGLKITLIPA